MKEQLITDTQRFIGATSRFGSAIPIYDDGYGPLFALRNSMGLDAIIRAQNESEAWEIAEDEFLQEADETVEDFIKEYGENWIDNDLWQEAYGFRPNGANEKDVVKHGIYQKDLNGEFVYLLTPEQMKDWGITLQVKEESDDGND